jgi:diphosphomevalonate decarboxylase
VPRARAGELSTIARQGSGSACRSLYGGFVRWEAGAPGTPGALDSKAVQVADEAHWPELTLLIAVASEKKKETGSTDGMQRSVATSPLLAHRAAAVVPARLAAIEAAYTARDFPTFARLTMADSNQFHATCLDTYPPVFYMNETSRRVVGLVHKLNGEGVKGVAQPAVIAGYTFDAGPNAVIFCLRKDAPTVLAALLAHFPPPVEKDAGAAFGAGGGYVSSPALAAEAAALVPSLPPAVACPAGQQAAPGDVRHIYVTSVGDGPRVLYSTGNPAASAPGSCLADCTTGLPHVVAAKADGVFDKAL